MLCCCDCEFRFIFFSQFVKKMSESDEDINQNLVKETKKRKKRGRIRDVMKKMRLATHESGEDCRCSRLKCFERISSENRIKLLREFNSLKSTDEQNIFLCGLMNVCSVKRKHSRKN